MSEGMVIMTIVLMALVTLGPRFLPVWLLAGRQLPQVVVTWLRYVPVAVLAALLAPELFLYEGSLNLTSSNLYLWVSLPTFLVAWKTRSLFLTVIVGMGLLALLRLWIS